jgi:hypothetical protein
VDVCGSKTPDEWIKSKVKVGGSIVVVFAFGCPPSLMPHRVVVYAKTRRMRTVACACAARPACAENTFMLPARSSG